MPTRLRHPHAPSRPADLLSRLYAPLVILSMLGLLVAAVSGLAWLAAVALGVALVADLAGAGLQPPVAIALERAGFRRPLQALLRSLLVAVAIGAATEGDLTLLGLYGLLAVAAHSLGIASGSLLNWVLAKTPALGIRNIGTGLELPRTLSRARRARPFILDVLLALEWSVVLGISVASAVGSEAVAVIVAALAATLMAAWTLAVVHWARHLVAGSRIPEYEQALLEELVALEPEVVVYMSAAGGEAGYILNQWLAPLAAMRRRAVIVVREASNLASIGDTPLPVIHAPRPRDVELMVLPSVKVALYAANAGRNVQLLREPAIKHVFLNHGDSDKATSANPVSKVYDEVWVAGEAAIDRYEAAGINIPRERFALIGRPQVEGLPVGPRPAPSAPCVLYAPTWEGSFEEVNYSSLESAGVSIVMTILEQRPDVSVIFKPHPSSGRFRPEMRIAVRQIARLLADAPKGSRHLVVGAHDDMSLHDCFALADALISDVSSVVTDFLHTERPIITTNPAGLTTNEFLAMFPTQEASYILGPDFEKVTDLVELALGEDPLAAARRSMKSYVLGELRQGPTQAFSENVDRVCDMAVADAARIRNSFMLSPAAAAARRATSRPSLVEAIRRRAGSRAPLPGG